MEGLAQIYMVATEPDGKSCLALLAFLDQTFFPRSAHGGRSPVDPPSPDGESPTAAASAVPAPLMDAAVRAWAVVCAMQMVDFEDADIENLSEAFLEILDHASMDVRVSAGEAVALLYELHV